MTSSKELNYIEFLKMWLWFIIIMCGLLICLLVVTSNHAVEKEKVCVNTGKTYISANEEDFRISICANEEVVNNFYDLIKEVSK